MNWKLFFIALFLVESGNDENEVNRSEQAYGPAQITQICLDDLNDEYGTDYELEDFRNRELSKWAVIHYGRMYGAESFEEYARIWHGGYDGDREKHTLDEWRRIKNLMEVIKNRK